MNIVKHGTEARIKIAFIILTYRNSDDCVTCLDAITKCMSAYDVRCYIVDSFYNEISSNTIESVAKDNKVSYTRINNNGYGYGNNIGIEIARSDFHPDYFIVCNPDTIIKSFPSSLMNDIAHVLGDPSSNAFIIAPDICNLNGKHQNPMIANSDELFLSGIYKGYKSNSRLLRMFWYGINRCRRELMLLKSRRKPLTQIYAPHGSFILFSSKAIDDLNPVFDPNIFLFAEELLLAHDAMSSGINIYYTPLISILHKEDGSVGFLSKANELAIESNIYVFEKTHNVSCVNKNDYNKAGEDAYSN